jgi:hypothetical protein
LDKHFLPLEKVGVGMDLHGIQLLILLRLVLLERLGLQVDKDQPELPEYKD